MYYTVNMAAVNYFGTQKPEIDRIDGQMEICLDAESTNLHKIDLTEHKRKTISQLQMSYYQIRQSLGL